jgi:hypothetical protein
MKSYTYVKLSGSKMGAKVKPYTQLLCERFLGGEMTKRRVRVGFCKPNENNALLDANPTNPTPPYGKPDARELGVGFVGFPYREPDTLRPRRNRHSQNAMEGVK